MSLTIGCCCSRRVRKNQKSLTPRQTRGNPSLVRAVEPLDVKNQGVPTGPVRGKALTVTGQVSPQSTPHSTAAPRVLRELITGYGSGYSQQSASHEVPYNQRPVFPGRDLIIQSNHEGGTRPPNSHGTQHAFSGRHRLHMTQHSDPKRNQTFLRRIQLADPNRNQ